MRRLFLELKNLRFYYYIPLVVCIGSSDSYGYIKESR